MHEADSALLKADCRNPLVPVMAPERLLARVGPSVVAVGEHDAGQVTEVVEVVSTAGQVIHPDDRTHELADAHGSGFIAVKVPST